jgi:hypothetical protein
MSAMGLTVNLHPDPTAHPLTVDALSNFVTVKVGTGSQVVTVLLADDRQPVEAAKWLRDAAEQLTDLAIRVERRAAVKAASA